jgi:hypothetical protein
MQTIDQIQTALNNNQKRTVKIKKNNNKVNKSLPGIFIF